MNYKKIEELEIRVATLEFALQQVQADVSRLLSAHGENVPTPAGALPIRHQDHD